MKVALNEKRKKLCGFSFSIKIENFEAFLLVFKLTKNLFFLKSVRVLVGTLLFAEQTFVIMKIFTHISDPEYLYKLRGIIQHCKIKMGKIV